MSPDAAQGKVQMTSSTITWFATERPTEGTVFVKPAEEEGKEDERIPDAD
jgi:hypothetical protein